MNEMYLPGFQLPLDESKWVAPDNIIGTCNEYATRLFPTVKEIRRRRQQYDGTSKSEENNHKQDASSKESEFAAQVLLKREGRLLSDPDTEVYTDGKRYGPDLVALDGGQNIHVKELSRYWDRVRGPSIVIQDGDKYLRSGDDPDLLVIMHKKRGAWRIEAALPASEVPKYLSPMAIEKYRAGNGSKNALYINDLPAEYVR